MLPTATIKQSKTEWPEEIIDIGWRSVVTSPPSLIKEVQILGKRTYGEREDVPKFTSGNDEKVKILVYFFIRDFNNEGTSEVE